MREYSQPQLLKMLQHLKCHEQRHTVTVLPLTLESDSKISHSYQRKKKRVVKSLRSNIQVNITKHMLVLSHCKRGFSHCQPQISCNWIPVLKIQLIEQQ